MNDQKDQAPVFGHNCPSVVFLNMLLTVTVREIQTIKAIFMGPLQNKLVLSKNSFVDFMFCEHFFFL